MLHNYTWQIWQIFFITICWAAPYSIISYTLLCNVLPMAINATATIAHLGLLGFLLLFLGSASAHLAYLNLWRQ